MPFSSADISGMVGGQMTMFSNQAQFSQQIGGSMGMSPMPAGGGMQNPFPHSENIGSRVAGGMGMAIPGMASGVALAGGLMGGAAGWLDPFTASARMFARGAGVSGAGFGATLGHVGSAFAQGGLRAGLGVMGGGLASAAVTALPFAAVGAGLSYMGNQMYQGAQNVSQMGAVAQNYMGPQWGQPGARAGGQMGRETINQMVGALHEIVGEEGTTTLKQLKGLMDQAGRMGMLTGIGDAQTFKSKMKDMVKQVRTIADILGTSIEEAAPMLGTMKQMGLWKTSDILGTAAAMRAAGPAGGQALLQSMQAGAQMSHAMGGTMRAGASMGGQSFQTMQAAVRAGTLSNEDVMEFTGGLGGVEGQAAVGQRMTGIMGRFGQTSAGRLMMAGLGETKEGKFTGGIDQAKLDKFMRGETGVGELQASGQAAARSKEGAMSFFRQADKMGQNLGAQGGMEAMIKIVQHITDTKFKGSEEARHQLFQQLLGVDNREAEMLGKLANDMDRIQDQKVRTNEAATRRAFEEADRKNLRSFDALKRSFGIAMDNMGRPLQEAGEKLATSISSTVDRWTEKMMGYTEAIPMSAREKSRLIEGGALKGSSQFTIKQTAGDWAKSSTMANLNMAIRQGNVLSWMFGGGSPREHALSALGISMNATDQEMTKGVDNARRRAESPSKTALGITDDKKLGAIKASLPAFIAKNIDELTQLKKNNPERYTEELLKRFEAAEGSGLFKDMSPEQKLNYLAVAQAEAGGGASGTNIDFKGDVARVGYPVGSEAARTKQGEILDKLEKSTGLGRDMLKEALTGEGSDVLMRFVKGEKGLTREKAIEELISRGDKTKSTVDVMRKLGQKGEWNLVRGNVSQKPGIDIEAFKKDVGDFAGWRGAELQASEVTALKAVASRSSADVSGLTKEHKEKLSKLLKSYEGLQAGGGGMEDIQSQTEALARSDISEKEVSALSQKGGAVGRQVAALHSAFGMKTGAGLDEKGLKSVLGKFQHLGFGVESVGTERLQEMVKGGKISAAESEEFKKELIKSIKGSLTESTEGKSAETEEYRSRMLYVDANLKFVEAVSRAMGVAGVDLEAAAVEIRAETGKQAPQKTN